MHQANTNALDMYKKKYSIDFDDPSFYFTTVSLKQALDELQEEGSIIYVLVSGGEFLNGKLTKNGYRVFKL